MLAVDTNIVVRYLTDDDPVQSARARQVLDGQAVFLATTVLLETAWVLRRFYKYTAADLVKAFRLLGGLADVSLEEPHEVYQAVGWVEAGMDFADALHLAKAGHCEAMLTFDEDFVRLGKRLAGAPVRGP